MSLTAKRLLVAVLAATAAFVGVWAQFLPSSFFTTFPLPGHNWVAPLPAYNEHLTRDVGGLYLALLTISAWAALRPRHETFAMVGLAWLVFSIPHLIYHSHHLGGFSTVDRVGNIVALGGTVVVAALLLLPGPRHARVRSNNDDRVNP